MQKIEEDKLFKKKKETEELMNALNIYYGLKSQYEANKRKNHMGLINNPKLSWREKRKEFKKLKPKCINCKRPVGTIFSSFYDEKEDGRFVKAQCGDRSSPCILNIEINLGKIFRLDEYLIREETEIRELKNDIILYKNNLIFSYITTEQALEHFEKTKEELQQITSNYELLLEKYINATENKERKNKLHELELQIQKNISFIKDAVKTAGEQPNVAASFQDVISFQINEMMPRLQQLREELMYVYNNIEYTEDNTYNLVQKRTSVAQIEENYSVNGVRVLALTTGIKSKV